MIPHTPIAIVILSSRYPSNRELATRTQTERYQRLKREEGVKVAGYAATFIGGLAFCYLMISLGVVDTLDELPGTQQEPALNLPTYLSFLSVMLTAVTVVLTAVAIGIGIVAAYTFRELSEKAETLAQKGVDKALSDEVIIARIDAIAFRKSRTTSLGELEEGFDPSDSGNR